MDAKADVCAGCYRTRDEIAAWSRMSNGQKAQLRELLAQREAEFVSFD